MDKNDGKILKEFMHRFEMAGKKSEQILFEMKDALKLEKLSEKRRLSDFELDARLECWNALADAF